MYSRQFKFLKPSEVAKILQLNLITIYGYIKEGKLLAVKFGRNYRIEERELEKFIRRNLVTVRNIKNE